MKKTPYYLSISHAAKQLGVSQETLRRWERTGKITSVRLDGKNRSFAQEDIEKIKTQIPLSISEAAKKLGISIHALRRLADKGAIKDQRNERHERVFAVSEIERYLAHGKEKKSTRVTAPSTKNHLNEPNAPQKPITVPVYSPLDMAHIIVHDVKTLTPRYNEKTSYEQTPAEPTFANIITTTEQEKTTPPDSFAGERLSRYFPVSKIRIIATLSAAIFLLTFLPLVTIIRLKHHSLPAQAAHGKQVLAASTQRLLGTLAINLPAEFTNNVSLQGNLTAENRALFQSGLTVQQGNIVVQNGSVTAPNLIYSVTGGNGVTVTGGQNPVVSFSGVTSVGGQTGDLSLTAGNGISIDGLKISSTDQTSGLKIFKTIKIGSDSFDASANNDILSFIAGNNVSLTPNLADKTITISGTATDNSGWINNGTFVTLKDSTENVGIGTSTPSHTLDISGTLNATDNTTLGANLSVTGNTTLSSDLTVGGGTTLAPTQSGTTTLTLRASTIDPGNILNITDSSGSNSYLSIDSTGALTVGGSTLTNAGILEAGNAIHLTDSSNAIIGTAVAGGWTFNGNTFTYRRTITVTNTSSTLTLPVNQPVTMSASGATAQDICSNTRSDSNDIRIGYGNTEIDRNIDDRSCNTLLEVSFQIQRAIAPGNSDTYYVYYDNLELTQTGPTYFVDPNNSPIQLDTADDASQWISSDNTNLAISQENTIKQEGTGSVKMVQTAQPAAVNTWTKTNQTQLTFNASDRPGVILSVNGSNTIYFYDSSFVYKGAIGNNGDITSWTNSPNTVSSVHSNASSMITYNAADGSQYLYILGGNTGNSYSSVIDRAKIKADGTPDVWSTTGQTSLPVAMSNFSAFTYTVNGATYVYVIGGTTNSSLARSSAVYRAQIDSDGNIGAWSTAGQAQLDQPLSQAAFAQMTINGTTYIYLIGGFYGAAVTRTANVLRASIDDEGNITGWATSNQSPLPGAQTLSTAVTNLNNIFLIGGTSASGSPTSNVYKGEVDNNGNVIDWTLTGQAQLPEARTSHAGVINTANDGNTYMYSLAGSVSGSPTNTVYKSLVSTNISTATKTISPVDLSNKRGIQLKVYSSVADTLLNFEFSNDGGFTWQTKNFSVDNANTWETKVLDIGSIANANKNTVSKIRFKIVNPPQAFTIYFDDIEATVSSFAGSAPTVGVGGFILGASDLTLNAQGAGEIKLNYDSTNALAGTGGLTLYNGGSTALFSIDSSGNLTATGLASLADVTASGTLTFSGLSTGILHVDSSGVVSSSALNLAGSSSEITGKLSITNGGTGLSSYAKGSMLYASSSNVLSPLSIGTTGQILQVVSGLPKWVSAASAGLTYFQENNGALAPINITDDLLLGGSSTASALVKFSGTTGGNSWINTGGNFGIGTTTPALKLDISDSQVSTTSAQISNTDSGINGDVLALKSGATTPGTGNYFVSFLNGLGQITGKIQGNGSNGVTYSTSGSDFAEYYRKSADSNDNDFKPGTVVCLSDDGGVTSCSSGTNSVIGVVSAQAGFAGGSEHDKDPHYVLVGLVGQLPVSISHDTSIIKPGDALQASNNGTAAKATLSGSIIGHALEAYDPAKNSGTILVSVQASWFQPTTSLNSSQTTAISNSIADLDTLSIASSSEITTVNNGLLVMGSTSLNDVSATSLSVGTTLKLDGTSINSLGTTLAIEPLKQADIDLMGGSVVIKTDGTLTVNQNATFNKDVAIKGTLSTEHLTVNQHGITNLSNIESIASASAGVITLTAGQTMRKVDTPFVHKNSLILLTPEDSTHGQTLYVTQKKDGESFVIKIDEPITTDITLDFLIIGEK